MCRLVALLHLNLFSYRNLWDWLDALFETRPNCLTLNWNRRFGQHMISLSDATVSEMNIPAENRQCDRRKPTPPP